MKKPKWVCFDKDEVWIDRSENKPKAEWVFLDPDLSAVEGYPPHDWCVQDNGKTVSIVLRLGVKPKKKEKVFRYKKDYLNMDEIYAKIDNSEKSTMTYVKDLDNINRDHRNYLHDMSFKQNSSLQDFIKLSLEINKTLEIKAALMGLTLLILIFAVKFGL